MLAKLRIAGKLLRKALGFRVLMNVISLDPTLVKGSHGALPSDERDWPVLIGTGELQAGTHLPATEVHARLLQACLHPAGPAS